MLMNLYVLIIIIPIVQITLCKTLTDPIKTQQRDDAIRLLKLVKKVDIDNKQVRSLLKNDAKYFDSIVESVSTSTTKKPMSISKKRSSKNDKNYHEIKILLGKLLEQIMELEKDKEKREDKPVKITNTITTSTESITVPIGINSSKFVKKKKKEDSNRRQRWGHWTDWSSCSVSCGKGRQIRWRHCVEHCDDAETEMEEKSCQLPACGPGKLFGVIQLR